LQSTSICPDNFFSLAAFWVFNKQAQISCVLDKIPLRVAVYRTVVRVTVGAVLLRESNKNMSQ
jgi:hypothetical protein